MREDVVRYHEPTRLELFAGEPEQLFVVILLGVEEDNVEHVVDPGQLLERVSLEQLSPLVDSRLFDVTAPGIDLRPVVLERQHAAAEIANPGGEPDRRVAARSADLEYLAVGLRRDEGEEEPTRGRLDLARTLFGREPALALGGVLALEAFEDGADAVIEHGSETIVERVRAELTIEIARTPEDVFAYLTDVSNLTEWQEGVKSASLRDGRIEETRTLLGRELDTTLEIVEREAPRVFTLRALDGPVRVTILHELEPANDGTQLKVTAEGDIPGGFAAGLVARRVEKQFRKDFERLKQILES
jgi:carbon monoxide dehydrogenase subunit G